jgi:hypothetical protein
VNNSKLSICKTKGKKFLWPKFACIVVFIMGSLFVNNAFAVDPGGDPDIPVDGGIGLLIAAGAGYGLKKLHDYRKNKKHGSL